MTAAISWRPQLGTTRIPACLHSPPDSLSQDLALNRAPLPHCQPGSHRVPSATLLLNWYREEAGCTFRSGLGRMKVSAGFNRRGRQLQLPSSCLPAHPAASPSPTRTKFPTCLSVSDSSSKYLAARAPAVLSPLRLLPCLPRGALQAQPGMGGGPEPRSLVGSGGSKGRRNQSQFRSTNPGSQAWGTEGPGRSL